MKIQIKTILGKLLFEYDIENNSIRKTLKKAIKERAYLTGADLRGAYLTGAYLRDAYLTGADLRGADLRGAYLAGAYLRDADLTGAYLRDADLAGAYLRDADLTGAYLRDADLTGADLRGADLRGAYLAGAYLRDADLTGAYLRDADLTGAYLRDADLTGAYLKYADLTPYRDDMFLLLLNAKGEIDNLKLAIKEGKIDGSTYEGECACLCGTLEKSNDKNVVKRIYDLRDASRPIEMFFRGIKKGDTPETSRFSELALKWLQEFEELIK